MVYAAVNEHIASGAIHALTIKAYTPAEWQTASKLNVSGG
jgi:acid stress-induced BolA-like protein IbaG/YrbA